MRLVHLADLHLGFRQFQRVTPTGVNQREADVALAFTRAVDKVIALKPDAVLIAGDVFHSVRPTNTAIVHAVRQVQRLVQALPAAPIIVIAGNHDAPRSSDTVCILTLFSQFGVTVVHRGVERVRVPELGLSVLCVPDVPRAEKVALEPDPEAKWNVLLLHGEIAGVMPSHGAPDPDRATGRYEAGDFARGWDYVALGHYHVYTKVGDRAFDAAIRDAVDRTPGGVEDKVVRLVVQDLPRHVEREIDYKAIREFSRRALHFQLDTRRPEAMRTGEAVSGAPGRRASLAETLRDRLLARSLDAGINREQLVALGLEYLRQADELAVPTAMGGEEDA
ncbi:MAG: metallophosphoesterase [Gemmatimonadetes bacterium]|nr:metallophosphoesterase [Gemmatimonadota bacterium]